jgi:hypothetical protein
MKKKIKSFQGTTVALIKQFILETSNSLVISKIKNVGVGYRTFDVENLKINY